MKTQGFYNTTNESGKDLEDLQKKALTQENVIACFFEANPGELYTPWEVRALAFPMPGRPPITSIRRAISNLTKAHILTKTDHKKQVGEYGHNSYSWILNEKYRETLGIMEDIAQGPPESHQEPIPMPLAGSIQKTSKATRGPKTAPAQLDIFGALGDALDPTGEQPREDKLVPINCSVCGRPLSDPESIRAGMGPVCAGKGSHAKHESYQGKIQYKGFGLWPSECEVVIKKVGEIYHILFINKSGTSVTNATEQLASGLMQANAENLRPGVALFYENYPERWDLLDMITYTWHTDEQGQFIAKDPKWTRVKDPEIYKLFNMEPKK